MKEVLFSKKEGITIDGQILPREFSKPSEMSESEKINYDEIKAFPKPGQIEKKRVKPGQNQQRHQSSNREGSIVGGSYMDKMQTAALKAEIKDGERSRELEDRFNQKNKISS